MYTALETKKTPHKTFPVAFQKKTKMLFSAITKLSQNKESLSSKKMFAPSSAKNKTIETASITMIQKQLLRPQNINFQFIFIKPKAGYWSASRPEASLLASMALSLGKENSPKIRRYA